MSNIHLTLCTVISFLFLGTAGVFAADGPVGTEGKAHAGLNRFEFSQPHMGTVFRIVLHAETKKNATLAANAAFQRIADLDQIMSDYRENSELMLLCKKSGGEPIKVSKDLFEVLAQGLELSARSEGAFDITVGPLSQLWRRARRVQALPSADAIAHAKELVGYEKMRLDAAAQTVQLTKEGMRLDLGAIAKGDAADQALAVLKQFGIESALVAAGGDIAIGHAPPDAEGWLIGIAPLNNPDGPPTGYLMLHDQGVSTSGDSEQHLDLEAQRYSHVIEPKSGQALTGRRSVTVVAPNCRASDSLGTAISVLGAEKGLALIDSTPGAAALYIEAVEQGEKSFESKRWKDVPRGKAK